MFRAAGKPIVLPAVAATIALPSSPIGENFFKALPVQAAKGAPVVFATHIDSTTRQAPQRHSWKFSVFQARQLR